MRKEQFAAGEYYHVYSRGVDRRAVFVDDRDRLRFVNSVYLLNNFAAIPFRFDILRLEPRKLLTPVGPYVEIAAGCLMSNHYHFLLSPKQDGGVTKLLHKIGTSYTMYFNNRHGRSGRLFESTFRAKHVDREAYAQYLTQYIHLNPVELFRGTPARVLQQVEEYQWSTLPDYLGTQSQFTPLVSLSFREEVLGMDAAGYQKLFREFYHMLVSGYVPSGYVPG